MNEYFIFPIANVEKYKANTLFDELTRNDELLNDDTEDADEEKSEFIDEKFSTWHRENKNGESNSTFLQFELEQGTKTSLMGGGAREAEDADQALASIQGSSGESQQKEYNQQETLEKKQTNMGKSGEHPFGEENKDVVQVIKEAKIPTLTEEKRYREFVADIEPFKRKLSSTIEKHWKIKRTLQEKIWFLAVYQRNYCRLYLKRILGFFIKRTRIQMKWMPYSHCLSIARHPCITRWMKRNEGWSCFMKY